MNKSLSKEVIDGVAHLLQGAVVAAPVVIVASVWQGAMIGFIAALYREHEQHFKKDGIAWILKFSFPGRWLDMITIAIGGTIPILIRILAFGDAGC